MANELMAVGLLALFVLAGVALTFNLVESVMGISMGLSFSNINGFTSGFWIILLRFIVAPFLTIICSYIIFNIVKEGS